MIQVEVVALKKVIGYVEIGPAVLVEVRHGDAKAIANGTSIDPCCFRDIGKAIAFVAKKFISSVGISNFPLSKTEVIEADRAPGVTEEVHVQVSILVVVKKYGMLAEANRGQSIFLGLFGEGQIPIIDKEFVVSAFPLHGARFADVNV